MNIKKYLTGPCACYERIGDNTECPLHSKKGVAVRSIISVIIGIAAFLIVLAYYAMPIK